MALRGMKFIRGQTLLVFTEELRYWKTICTATVSCSTNLQTDSVFEQEEGL